MIVPATEEGGFWLKLIRLKLFAVTSDRFDMHRRASAVLHAR